MTEWVLNASPIIVLSRLNLLAALEVVIPNHVIPRGVADEINAGPNGNPASVWVAAKAPSSIVVVPALSPVVTGWDLGRGETEVLSWAHEHKGHGVILDDFAARRCATALGIPLRGTLALLVSAKRFGLIRELKPVLDELPRVGFRISSALADEAKRLAGE